MIKAYDALPRCSVRQGLRDKGTGTPDILPRGTGRRDRDHVLASMLEPKR
jgi:hypothetical protein